MGLQDLINKALSENQEALMDYPLHIRRTFARVGVYEDPYRYMETPEKAAELDKKSHEDCIRENAQKFSERWGGLEEIALLRALREDEGIDRLKAIFAIGYSSFPQSLDTIAPYLESPNRLERCATACVMGIQQDERAIEVLKEFYLHDDLDASGKMISDAEFWYQNYYAVIALVLANWGPPDMTEILRSALLRISAPDYPQTIAYQGNEYTPTHLFYALGRRGLFSIIEDVPLSKLGRNMALYSLAAGSLNMYERYETPYLAVKNARRDLVNVWKKKLRLSDQEIQECFSAINELGTNGDFSSLWWRKYED